MGTEVARITGLAVWTLHSWVRPTPRGGRSLDDLNVAYDLYVVSHALLCISASFAIAAIKSDCSLHRMLDGVLDILVCNSLRSGLWGCRTD